MRILIADDDATSRLLLKAMASKLGHECLVAEDGSSAWELLSSEGIDVLLTDWMMPGLDGPELCRRVRDELSGHYIYIVLITGLGHPEQVLEGMGAGADDYLIKPVDPFAVQTRLVAAERVTSLHRQVADFRAQLEQANIELLERSLTDPLTGPRQPSSHGGGPGAHPRPGAANRATLRHGAVRHRPLQALQRPLRASRRRRGLTPGRTVSREGGPSRRERLPLWRRGVPSAPARLRHR